MDFVPGLVAGGAALVFLLVVSNSTVFTIHTKQAAIVERFGKFERIAGPGLNFKLPLVEKVVYTEDLNMQLMDVPVMSKTKDDATVTVPVRVQYFVLPDKVKEAYYELDDPEDQIKWLYEWWRRIDDWVESQGEETPDEAAVSREG